MSRNRVIRAALLAVPLALGALLALALGACEPRAQRAAAGRPAGQVPIVRTMPDLVDIADVGARKQRFCEFLRPIIAAENGRVLAARERLAALASVPQCPGGLARDDSLWLADLAADYGLEDFAPGNLVDWRRLRRRVDIVPVELALAQAAHESAWGTSRFARLGNAVFGQWCYDTERGIVPRARAPEARHRVAAFASVNASVRGYLHNLNTHAAYRSFRTLRAAARAAGQPLDARALAGGLERYSQRRAAYVRDLRALMRQNPPLLAESPRTPAS